MKTIVILATLVAAALAIPTDTYDPAYDDYDINELIGNDRVLLNLGNCFLDQGPCNPDMKKFKKVLPEALRTKCGKCTPKQRGLVRQVVHAFKEKQSELWEKLVEKHDPKGEFKAGFNEFLNAQD